MAERERRIPLFRQSFRTSAALATRWPPYLRAWHPAKLKPGRLKRVDGITVASRKDFRAPQTHHARKRFDYANYRKRRRKSTYLPKRKLVAEHLHSYAGG